jgi:hypothetical protein
MVEGTSADNGIDRRILGQDGHERILTDGKFNRAAVTLRVRVLRPSENPSVQSVNSWREQ